MPSSPAGGEIELAHSTGSLWLIRIALIILTR